MTIKISQRPLRDIENKVREFHRAGGITVGLSPAVRDPELRARLIIEEALETAQALLCAPDVDGAVAAIEVWTIVDKAMRGLDLSTPSDVTEQLARVVDGMCDEIYVISGTAVACGTPLDRFFEEVHRVNMTKMGGPVENGKLLKPKGFRPPRIRELLDRLRPDITEELQRG